MRVGIISHPQFCYTISHMISISVTNLKRYFKVYKRASGLLPALGSIFKRPTTIVKAVDNISFKIDQGEFVAFIGPNGAGKTTTLKCLSGLLYPSEGSINVLGFNPYERKSIYLKMISLVMGQKNQLWWDLPASDTFRLNKEIYELSDKEFKSHLNELTRLLEVKELIKIPVRHLSLGQRMKMELIAALIHKPKVLFLDEPTIGLDVVMQKKMREFISQYNKIYKSTILLTSHNMADVKQLCKRVIIIDRGKIIYDGNLSDLVNKYAQTKIISVDFNRNIEENELKKLGSLRSYIFPKAIFQVKRENAIKLASKLLQDYEIEDLNIEDPDIEEIIRIVFNKGLHG